MKYSSNNKPLECMMTQSVCYKGTKKMTVKGVLWHSTGANNPTLKRYVQPDDNAPNRAELLAKLGTNIYNNDWNHIYHEGGMNCWIGKLADGTVTTVQTLPWDYRPWGCGAGSKGSCNDGWIQFEICEDALNDSVYFNKVYQEACEITAYLCKMFNIDPHGRVVHNGITVPTILCHADSHSLGLGSGHADINHWFPKFGKSMTTARDDVAALLKTAGSNSGGTNNSTPSGSVGGNTSTSSNTKMVAGKMLNLQNVNLYGSSTSKTSVGARSGVYYIWSGDIVNGKIRITNNLANVGVISQVTGWIDYKDAEKSTSTTTSSGATASTPYTVKINTDALNIRKGAGTNYASVGVIKDKGIYTIVDEATGTGATKWGLLKLYSTSRNGWISLDYCQKV